MGKTKQEMFYTINELNKLIIPTSKINQKYESGYQAPFMKDLNTEIKEELFRAYPKDERIEVSNFGRIRIFGEVQEQEDVYKFAGMLYLKNWKEIIIKGVPLYLPYVYNYVAKTWLEPHNNDNNIWDIHHLSNDGYDNSPQNLIWITRNQHKRINHRTKE